jgi:SsrA-binding protein
MPNLATNKKARFDYEILEKFEAGIILAGNEVKSVRTGLARLNGTFVTFHGNEAFLTNSHIPQFAKAMPDPGYNPEKSRKLLLKSKEINYLRGKTQERGLTVVPLSLYTKGRRIKLEIALVRGKKEFDKRETIKKRDSEREMRRMIK